MTREHSSINSQERLTEKCPSVPMERSQSTRIFLPQDVVEKIIAMMPFPHIFKARTLSKFWLARFSSITALKDEDKEKKRLVSTFQELVTKYSRNWTTFCPIRVNKEDGCAYDLASQAWRRIPSLSFLPQNLLITSPLDIQGPLVLFSTIDGDLCVANLLTRTWKRLHCSSVGEGRIYCANIVMEISMQSYKVVVFCQLTGCDRRSGFLAKIYDSKSGGSLTSKKLNSSKHFKRLGPAVYLHGALYMLADFSRLLAFNVEEETLEELDMLEGLDIDDDELDMLERDAFALVACNAGLLMVVTWGDYRYTYEAGWISSPFIDSRWTSSYQVLKIDLWTGRLVKVAEGPPDCFNVGFIQFHPLGHGDNIFFGVEEATLGMLTYNVLLGEWDCLPSGPDRQGCGSDPCLPSSLHVWSHIFFQPGFNPFVAV